MTRVAIIGCHGVPANYGGFETLVENLLGDNCPPDVEYTVFCSAYDYRDRPREFHGARLKYVRLRANGAQSVPYDVVSLCRAIRGYDAVLVLGVSGCLFLPVFRLFNRRRLIVNIDGLEHRRAKWGRFARRVLRASEAMAVRMADVIIADNKGIQDYVTETYGKPSELIAYGGDHVRRELSPAFVDDTLARYGLSRGGYAISVCRIEPENNSHLILEAFAKAEMPLVFIGNWDHSEYSRGLRERYSGVGNIRILDAIYDLDILYALRSNAGIYVHGHSAGGTNPSLVEAMFFGMPILAYDVVYNRETTEGRAYYFRTAEDIRRHLGARLDGAPMTEIAARRYTWRHIAAQYCDLYSQK